MSFPDITPPTENLLRCSVAVLGAGVCGLAAAWHLLERDPRRQVLLLEAESHPGGLARSLTLDGHAADLGPHRIFTELEDVQRFLSDIVGDELYEVRRRSRMWLRGRWIEYPPKPWQAAAALGLGRTALAGMSFLSAKGGALVSPPEPGPDTFEAVMKGAFGPRLYDLLVGPYAEKVWKTPGSQLHGDIARVRVSAGGLDRMVRRLLNPDSSGPQTALQKFHYIPGGVEQLVRKLSGGIRQKGARLLSKTRVRGIGQLPGGRLRIEAADPCGERVLVEADHAISTIPLPDLLRMLLVHSYAERIDLRADEMRYIANFLVCLSLRKRRVSDAQWLYFPGADTIMNRGYEPGNFDEAMRGKSGGTMLVCEVTTHDRDALFKWEDGDLVEAVMQGLGRVGLAGRDDLSSSLVHRIPATYPLYDLHYRGRIETVIDWLRGFPRLVSTGRQGLFLHNNMDHSIHMGFDAARCVLGAPDAPAAEHYAAIDRFLSFRIVD